MRDCASIPFADAIAAWRKLLQSGYTVKEDPRRLEGDTVSKARRRAGYTNLCPVCGALPGEPGFVRMDWPVGHVYFGRPVQCPRCGDPRRPGNAASPVSGAGQKPSQPRRQT